MCASFNSTTVASATQQEAAVCCVPLSRTQILLITRGLADAAGLMGMLCLLPAVLPPHWFCQEEGGSRSTGSAILFTPQALWLWQWYLLYQLVGRVMDNMGGGDGNGGNNWVASPALPRQVRGKTLRTNI